jgi:twitching motility two-component system response regulator PilH
MAIKKVLVCDDSGPDRANLERIVAGTGCTVISAANGKEALAKARAEKPDMIFLDILMPEMDGYETCRMLANDPETKHIPVIFVTSKSARADRVWAQMQGGKGYIAKPFQDKDVVAELQGAH